MRRRTFLKSVLALLSSTAAVSFGYPMLRFLEPAAIKSAKIKFEIKKSEIPIGEAKDIVFNNKPVIIINRPKKGYIALSRVCTHLGCLVEYDRGKNILLCPCHAGTFNMEGNVISGPPPRPLQRFPLELKGENILIG